MRKERATGTQSKKEAGNIPGKQDDIAHCQDFQCGCFRVIDTDPMEDKRRVTWGGRGQSCVSLHVFLPPTLQLKQDHKSDRRHCHCAVSWLLPTKGLSLMYYSIEKGPKSVINSNFRMFANSQSLLVNTYQQ